LLDEIDIKFLLLIIRGHNNSYAIYNQLKKEAEEKGSRAMTYKNANRRILLLVQNGAIEEIKYTERVPHGRIDYKLTMKGLEYLIPHFLSHPEEIKELVDYINEFRLDKVYFISLLTDGHTKSIEALNEFQRHTGMMYNPTESITYPGMLYNAPENTTYPQGSFDFIQEVIISQEKFEKSLERLDSASGVNLEYIQIGRKRVCDKLVELKAVRDKLARKITEIERRKKIKQP
jgi:hypothetical protein